LKSNNWFTSDAMYVQIEFGRLVSIKKITLTQLTGGSYVAFNKFKISYANDTTYFARTNDIIYPNPAQSFDYLPFSAIKCRFLRIHITELASTPETIISGLIVNDILGKVLLNDTTLTQSCANTLTKYGFKSSLYISDLGRIFICTDTINVNSDRCFTATNIAPTTWKILPKEISKIVFTTFHIPSSTRFIFALGDDGVSYYKSIDEGSTFTSVSQFEYDKVKFLF
jgi:hypothetical protein